MYQFPLQEVSGRPEGATAPNGKAARLADERVAHQRPGVAFGGRQGGKFEAGPVDQAEPRQPGACRPPETGPADVTGSGSLSGVKSGSLGNIYIKYSPGEPPNLQIAISRRNDNIKSHYNLRRFLTDWRAELASAETAIRADVTDQAAARQDLLTIAAHASVASQAARICGERAIPAARKAKHATGDEGKALTGCPGHKVGAVTMSQDGSQARGFQKYAMYCGGVWVCRTCSGKIKAVRRNELGQLFDYARTAEKSALCVTLTAPHDITQKLADIKRMTQRAWKLLTQSKIFHAYLKRFGYWGRVFAPEITYSDRAGWHFHIHSVYLLNQLTQSEINELTQWFTEKWVKVCAKVGLTSAEKIADHLQYGCRVQVMQGQQQLEYLVKVEPWELSSNSSKAAKLHGLTPWEIQTLAFQREAKYIHLYREYLLAVYGLNSLTWSKGLKSLVGVETQTDKEIMQGDNIGDDIHDITKEANRIIEFKRGRSDYLTALEAYVLGDSQAMIDFEARYGVKLKRAGYIAWAKGQPLTS